MSLSLPAKVYIMKKHNPLSQTKMYCSILKTFYNEKKITLILPLLVKDTFLTDVCTNANISINFLLSNVHP